MRRSLHTLLLLVAFSAAAVIAFRQLLVMDMPGKSFKGALPPISTAQSALARRLESDVTILAGRIGERNMFRQGTLDRAAQHIRQELEAAGHAVAFQNYIFRGKTVRNVEAVVPGKRTANEVIVVGAHYDSIRGSPGANDNASGVAALLELGRAIKPNTLQRDIRLVAFVNEEPPFFYSDAMGSVQYVNSLAARGDKVTVMISLETIGYYSDTPGSQRYPFPLSYFYPDTGNFIGFVANPASKAMVRKMVKSFRDHADFPSEGLAAPEWIRGIGWSDHWSFWQQGYPAVMITDTALYRYREYHSARDLPQILTYDRFARVVEGLVAVVIDVADEQ